MVLARLLQKLGLAKAKPAAVGEHDRAIRELSEATARNPSDARRLPSPRKCIS
jgi:hypothetical protein